MSFSYKRYLTLFSSILLLPLMLLYLMVSFAAAADVPPALDLNGDDQGASYSATFTEDEGPEPIVSVTGLRIDNGDDPTLTSAKAVLTNRPDMGIEKLSANPGLTGLKVAYAPETGELTIKGNASVENYEQVLRTLTYENTSQSPDIADRVVLVTVNNGTTLTSPPVTSTVSINSVNDAPALDNTGNMVMTSIMEDDPISNGNSVTTIIKSAEAGGEDRITDLDKNSPEGFAVIEAASSNGSWQYSINSGSTWSPFGAVSNTSAVLLDGAARIRFVPNPNFSGSASFLFRAWDQSGGRQSGATGIDVSLNGGIEPFSSESEMVTINIEAVNDLPVVDLNGPEAGINQSAQFFESGPPVPVAHPQATITDNDNQMITKLAVTLINRPDGAQEKLDAITDVITDSISIVPYNPTSGELILNGPDTIGNFQRALRQIIYTNTSKNPATITRTVTVVAHDGLANGLPALSSIKVNPVNSAPVLNESAILMLASVPEDTSQPAGQTVASIIASGGDPISDPDPGALEGIGIVAAGNASGQWHYSLANPPATEADWLPVGAVSESTALLLVDSAWLRYVPLPNFVGQSDPLTIRAWDRTSGYNGQRVSIATTGGNSAYSTATNKIGVEITAINDLPVIGGLPATPLLFVEDAGPLPLADSTLTVTDSDSPLLASATVRLTNPQDGDAEWLLVTTEGTNITSTYENGVIELTGVASPAAYQQVLRTLEYLNTSQDPDPTNRVIEFSVADNQASGPVASMIVQIQPVNDSPELDLNGVGSGLDYSTLFFINRGPVPIVAESMTVTDIDNTTLRSATIQISNLINPQREILSVDVTGTNIKKEFDLLTGLLKLTGTDSVASYQQVLRTLTYDNSLIDPDTTARVIEFVVSDASGSSQVRTTTVNFIVASNIQLYFPIVSWVQPRGEEPNDSCAEALGIDVNQNNQFRPDDKDDWFFFELAQASDLTVELRNFSPREGQIIVAAEKEPGKGCGSLELLANNGSNATDKIVNLGRRPARRYFIWIINDGAASSNSFYRLYVRAVP